MTTTASETVDLTSSNGQAPKRRGRPPGSKNKPKDAATPKRGRPRKKATATKKTAVRRPRKTATAISPAPSEPTIHAIVVEDDGVLMVTSSGAQKFRSHVIVDHRTK